MSLGEKLRELRLQKDLTIRELAKIFNIGKTTVANYEKNERKPDYEMLKKFAEFYNVTVDYLVGLENKNQIAQSSLSPKNEREIEKILEQTRESLEKNEGLMLSGDPVSPEAIESILEALEFGMRQAKKLNKKYTPKKYRSDE